MLRPYANNSPANWLWCDFVAIRSGDYYLFEDESEAHTEDLTSITIGVDSEEEKDDDKADPLRVGGHFYGPQLILMGRK